MRNRADGEDEGGRGRKIAALGSKSHHLSSPPSNENFLRGQARWLCCSPNPDVLQPPPPLLSGLFSALCSASPSRISLAPREHRGARKVILYKKEKKKNWREETCKTRHCWAILHTPSGSGSCASALHGSTCPQADRHRPTTTVWRGRAGQVDDEGRSERRKATRARLFVTTSIRLVMPVARCLEMAKS